MFGAIEAPPKPVSAEAPLNGALTALPYVVQPTPIEWRASQPTEETFVAQAPALPTSIGPEPPELTTAGATEIPWRNELHPFESAPMSAIAVLPEPVELSAPATQLPLFSVTPVALIYEEPLDEAALPDAESHAEEAEAEIPSIPPQILTPHVLTMPPPPVSALENASDMEAPALAGPTGIPQTAQPVHAANPVTDLAQFPYSPPAQLPTLGLFPVDASLDELPVLRMGSKSDRRPEPMPSPFTLAPPFEIREVEIREVQIQEEILPEPPPETTTVPHVAPSHVLIMAPLAPPPADVPEVQQTPEPIAEVPPVEGPSVPQVFEQVAEKAAEQVPQQLLLAAPMRPTEQAPEPLPEQAVELASQQAPAPQLAPEPAQTPEPSQANLAVPNPLIAGRGNSLQTIRAMVRPALPLTDAKVDLAPRTTVSAPTMPLSLISLAHAGITIVRTPAKLPPQRVELKSAPWLLTALVTMIFVAVGIGAVTYLTTGSSEAEPSKSSSATASTSTATNREASTNDAPQQSTAPALNKQVEVTGFRMVAIANQSPEIHYLVVNHSAANLSNLNIYVTLRTPDARPGRPPFSRFSFRAPELGPYESKEMVSPIERIPRQLTLPEWQNLTAEVEIAR